MSKPQGAFRLALEIGALGAMGWWGYEQGDGGGAVAAMIGVPAAGATLWGVLTVPGDPSRGKNGPVAVPGLVRLAIELGVFGFATWALHDLDETGLAAGLGGSVVLHYGLTWDRVRWLLGQ